MDPTAAHNENPAQARQPDDYRTQVRTLLDDYAAHGQRFRALHERYLALLDAGMSNEQRREALRCVLDSESVVLAEAQAIKLTLDALLQEHRSHLRAGT